MKIDTKSLVYLFDGEEEFLKEEARKKLEAKLLSEQTKDFNRVILYGQDHDGNSIVSEARTFPFLGSKRLIVVKDADKLSFSDIESLISYLKNPAKTACLVLETKKADRSRKLYQAVARYGCVVTFDRLYGGKIERWVSNRIRLNGKSISKDAASILREDIGNDLRSLALTIEKIVTYVGERVEISARDVEEVAGKSFKYRIFDLTDAIGRKQKSEALRVLYSLVHDGRKASEIIHMLFWQLKRIWQAKRLLAQGVAKEKIGQELKVHRFFLEDFITQTKNFREEELDHNFDLLLEADIGTKTGGIKPKVTLELLVVRLCS